MQSENYKQSVTQRKAVYDKKIKKIKRNKAEVNSLYKIIIQNLKI